MKYTNRRAFEKHLEGAFPNHFSDLYLIIGKESAERKEAVDVLTGYLLRGEANPSLCVKTFDAERLSMEELQIELHGFSILSSQRTVVINQGEKLSKPIQGALEVYFSRPNPSLRLVISAAAVHANTNFYKKAEKCGIIFDIVEEKPWEKEKTMKEWVLEYTNREGKKIDPPTAAAFLKIVGCEQAAAMNELEKVLCYIGERPAISLQDITAVCTKVNLENGWQLGESIFRCDVRGALRIVRALMEEGDSFLTLLRQVRSQFQTEFQVCSILSSGGTPQNVSQQFPYMKGMILDRHVQNAQSYGMRRFKLGLLKIDEAELKFKSSAQSPDVLMETLIIKLATR